MTIMELRQAVQAAQADLQRTDYIVSDMAVLLVGRLRHVPPHTLKKLKAELTAFNRQTGRWMR